MTNTIYYKDDEIKSIFKEIDNSINIKKNKSNIILFKELYSSKTLDDISWTQLCDNANKLGCYKYIFYFIYILLNNNLYKGDYREKLYELLPEFNEILKKPKPKFKILLCGAAIEQLLIFKTHYKDCNFRFIFIPFKNSKLKLIYTEFIQGPPKQVREHENKIIENFEVSLGTYCSKINSYEDFNDHTFWEQINFYKKYYLDNSTLRSRSIAAICDFYRWIVNQYPEYNHFNNSFTLTRQLLFNRQCARFINEDYFFTTYSPQNHPGNREKILFILRGFENQSTQLLKEDFFSVNLSKVKNPLYRKSIISYIITNKSITIAISNSESGYIFEAMNFITNIKAQPNYPNPSLKYMTNQEAVLIRNFFNDDSLQSSTLNNKIGSIRRFLMWNKDANLIEFDDMFFNYLIQYEEPSSTSGNSIPDDKLEALNKYIIADSKENIKAKLMYVIFHIAIQTEFRISQICHLLTNCIKPSVKPNEYIIHSNSKTSNGKKKEIITSLTYHLLMSAIEYTEELRESCNINSVKDYIFIYKGDSNSIWLINANSISCYLKKACQALGFDETYTASNLRDTHMTKAFEHVLRNGKSDIELSVLSKHKHIDTTKNHYIEMELEKMLEATYGIIIGDSSKLINVDSKIVDEIPSNLVDFEVDDGCGNCSIKDCVMITSLTSLPCFLCDYFITTVEHEKFFVKAIENVDRLISYARTLHDKEDLITTKTLYVQYLKAIYKRKEELQ